MFSPELAEKPYLVAYNKMDLPEAYENWISFKERLNSRGIEPFCMSAVSREGTQEVIYAAYELVRKRTESTKEEGYQILLVPFGNFFNTHCFEWKIEMMKSRGVHRSVNRTYRLNRLPY